MKIKIRQFFVLFFTLIILSVSRSFAASSLDIRQIQGLPQSEINAILEDSRGLVWIATLDGLFRYDGRNYVAYRNSSDENSLSSSMILSLAEDRAGNIWVGTYGRGICRLDPRTGEIKRYSLKTLLGKSSYANDIVTIAIDKSDNIWIANVRGVVRLALNHKTFDIESAMSFPISEREAATYDYINKIHFDRRGQMWLGGSASLKRVLKVGDGKFECEVFSVQCSDICDYDDNSVIVSHGHISMFEREEGDTVAYKQHIFLDGVSAMHVVCQGSRSISFGGRYGWFNMTQDVSDKYKWSVTKLFTRTNLPFPISTSAVSALEIVGGDQIWVGTRGGGIITMHERFNMFYCYPSSPKLHKMPQTIIKAVAEDNDGNLWFGTEEDGVYIQNRSERYCHNMKRLLVNPTDDRAYCFAQSGGKVDSMGRMTRSVMWVGTTFPCYLRAIDTKTLRSFMPDFETSQIGFVFALCMSDDNTLWAGTYNNGLWRLKLNRKGHIVEASHFITPNSKISSNVVRSLYVDYDGTLWIGTDMGINRIESWDLDSETPLFRQNIGEASDKFLNDHYILQITQASSGEMLFGSMGSGLIIYESDNDKLSFVTTKDGLTSDSVKSIVEDPKSGNLWLSTNNGITSYNIKSKKLLNFGHPDGILETEFSEICGIQRSSGEMIFGNRVGFVSFMPQEIPSIKSQPHLIFTDLFVNYHREEVARGGKDAILTRKLEFTKNIELDYEDRNFAIGFVGVNYKASRDNRYRYKLEGLDKNWREISADDVFGRELLAQYTNVPNGRYTFRVCVANRNGEWFDKELTLGINVLPPWYRSSTAYLIYVLLIIAVVCLVCYIVAIVIRRRREAYVAKMEQFKAEDMMQYKLEFFMNISHEFRTPLTLLNIPLESIRAKSKSFDVEQYFSEDIAEMRYNVEVLTNLINQLLDFRKIERGNEMIQVESVDIIPLLGGYIEHFQPLAKRNKLSLTLSKSTQPIVTNVDSRHFEKIITNIVSNAFKFTQSGGSIAVLADVDSLRNVVVISIKDNGAGISSDDLPHIFDRFYSSDSRSVSKVNSSGIGLALCKGLVEMMGGRIWMESELGVGSTCYVELPKSQKIIEKVKVEQVTYKEREDVSEKAAIRLNETKSSRRVEKPLVDAKSKPLILIVDDSKPLLNQLIRSFRDEYRVITAENGVEGLEKCRKELPDMIVTDVVMPKMSGIEMSQVIKSDDTISHIPILILSGETSVRSKIDSFAQGAVVGYIEKPFSMEMLRSNIATILRDRDLVKSRLNRDSIVAPDAMAQTPSDLKFIKKIIAVIKENISNPDLSVEYIASRTGVSRAYLSRKIKDITGETSAQFVRNIRLRYAAELIAQDKMNISEVALSVGYVDINSFRTRFKELYGVSPTHYNGEGSASKSKVEDLV